MLVTDTTDQLHDDERRDFFRVSDTVKLAFRTINLKDLGEPSAEAFFEESPAFTLMRELRSIDHENSSLLRSISDNNREIEVYLKGLNRKIEMVASAIIADHEHQQPLRKVVISEGGIDFSVSESIAPGTYMALQLTLLPEHLGLYLFAKVIRCREIKTGVHHLTLHFENIKDAERQVLAKHVMQVQIKEKRKASEE